MEKKPIEASELIINPDGSAFHIHLKPDQVADKVILVGDPGRVEIISKYFDKIECRVANREFFSCTGEFSGKRITVVGTGIGTDNIDIVLTELDALVNIDFNTRTVKDKLKSLELVRIGTSGSLQKDLDIDTWLLSEYAIGFDGVLNYYANRNKVANLEMEAAFCDHVQWSRLLTAPYFVPADPALISRLSNNKLINKGITISAPGFYGPQGRVVRLDVADPELNEKLSSFRYEGHRITNYEMECSAIYGLSRLMGHRAATVCAIIANRKAGRFTKDYTPVIKGLIEHVLTNI
ncbi:MAG: nucleoside phosphorylase [Marinilabiliaceae bacterium]|nr:nucleoside phosphorylase [Marinilabiliaceae bacterium]